MSAVVTLGLGATTLPARMPSAKLIYYGWNMPDTQAMCAQAADCSGLPFDGSGVVVAIDRPAWARGQTGTSNSLSWRVMGARRFASEEFVQAKRDLEAVSRRTSLRLFLPVNLSGDAARNVDWFDDERWQGILGNIGVLADIGRSGSAEGFILDPEHYSERIFKIAPFVDVARREGLKAKVRQRGRAVMEAIAARMPDAVMLALYGHSLVLKDPSGRGEYELLGPFLDGILEGMSGRSILVDGFEFSYGFREREQFVRGAREIRELGEKVTGVREAFRRRVRPGFGLWVDYRQKLSYWSPLEFARAVGDALEVSGSYVWIYGQTVRFFPPDRNAEAYGVAVRRVRSERGL